MKLFFVAMLHLQRITSDIIHRERKQIAYYRRILISSNFEVDAVSNRADLVIVTIERSISLRQALQRSNINVIHGNSFCIRKR